MAEKSPSPRAGASSPTSPARTRRGKGPVEIKLELLDTTEATLDDVDVSLKCREAPVLECVMRSLPSNGGVWRHDFVLKAEVFTLTPRAIVRQYLNT